MLCELSQESEHCDKLSTTVSWIWHQICAAGALLHNAQDRMLALHVLTDMMFCLREPLHAVKASLQQAKLLTWGSHMQYGSAYMGQVPIPRWLTCRAML